MSSSNTFRVEQRQNQMIKIRNSKRIALKNAQRQQNIRFLHEFAKQNHEKKYINILADLYYDPQNSFLINKLLKDLDQLKLSFIESTESSWKYFMALIQILFQYYQVDRKVFCQFFQIGLMKSRQYLNLNNQSYVEYMKIILSFIDSGILIFLSEISNDSFLVIEFVLRDLFVNYDKQWQSPCLLEDGLNIIYSIFKINDNLETLYITNQIVTLKQRKHILIKYVFYQQPIFFNQMFEILQNKHQQHLNIQIKQLIIKVLINLTHWAQSDAFVQPLVKLNIYQYAYNLMETEESQSMNRLIVTLIQNLLLLDYEITQRGYQDGIIQKLVSDIVNNQQNIDINSHLSCLGNYILQLDLRNNDIRNQIKINSNFEGLVSDKLIDPDTLLTFLSALKCIIDQYGITLQPKNISILERIYFDYQDTNISRQISEIMERMEWNNNNN